MDAATIERSAWTPIHLDGDPEGFFVASGGALTSTDPTDGSVVAVMSTSTVADVDAVVARAHAALQASDWRNNGARRARVLLGFADRIRNNADRLAELLCREQGKLLREARTEVLQCAEMTEFYAGLARVVYGRAIPLGNTAHSVVLREPVGVVGVITPWNWPLILMVRAIAPALAAGNAVVVKPASLTPAITAEFLVLLAEVPALPRGVLSLVVGAGGLVGDALVGHPGIGMVAFTGETSTGIGVMRRAANDLRRVSLELGGKSPNIVFADANMDKAIDGAINAAFTTSGQICTAGSRLLLDTSIHDAFLERMAERVRAIRVGDPLDPTTTMAPVVSKSQQHKIMEYVDLGKSEGRLVVAGELPSGDALADGAFVAPVIFADLPASSRLVREEIFGPVLVVQKFSSEKEAIALAEDSDFGLAAGIWTTDLDRAWRVGRALHAGSIWINTYHHFYSETEVGGFRKSGLGRQQGMEGIFEFTEMKHLNFDHSPTLW